MPITGPIPKESPARNNPRKVPDLVLERRTDDKLLGPPLPSHIEWCEKTKEWYKKWRKSDIAPKLLWSDWEALHETALLHNDLWSGVVPPGSVPTYMGEIRRRVAAYGYTVEDRLKLQIKFADKEDLPSATENLAKINYKDLVD